MIKISFSDIQQAQKRIQPYIKKTLLQKSQFFSKEAGLPLFLKWETQQEVKSFKLRGALNKVLSLSPEEQSKGLIAASAGNHAQGLALAARYCKSQARIVMMETAAKTKIEATKKLGAEVILKGKTYDESYAYAKSIQGDSIFVHAYADPFTIAGQATVALEILESQKDIDSIIVPIGGGGLIAGVSFAVKHLKPNCKVYGVAWAGTPSFCQHYHKKTESCICSINHDADMQSQIGLTDGLAVKEHHPEVLNFCKPYIDDIACVSQEEISKVVVDVATNETHIAEGSGVAALAGLLKKKKDWDLGSSCAVVISGGNIDSTILSSLIKKYRESA